MKGSNLVIIFCKWLISNERSNKFLELMDNAEKAIEQVNADQIYTSKQFQRIKDNFFVSKYCDLDMDAHGQLS